jgi:hypothetical protein
MRSEEHVSSARRHSRDAALVVLLAGCALLANEAAAQVQVTSLAGVARVGSTPLALHALVPEGRPLAVETGGRCSLLLASRNLVRICGHAEASVTAAGSNRPGEIELREGALVVVALARSQEGAFRIHTPATTIFLQGSGAHVSVAPGSGETVVSALESPVRLSQRDGSDAMLLEAGWQQTLRPGEDPAEPRVVARESLQRGKACLGDRADLSATLRASRAMLAAGLPMVITSPGAVDATPTPPVNDLLDIIRADVPADGLPLQASTAPSALVTELSKRGMDVEVCDPITCNPVYQLDPPGSCGVPPERGCIP